MRISIPSQIPLPNQQKPDRTRTNAQNRATSIARKACRRIALTLSGKKVGGTVRKGTSDELYGLGSVAEFMMGAR